MAASAKAMTTEADSRPTVFFAYAASPAATELMGRAVTELNDGGVVRAQTWEQLRVSGKIVVSAVCKAIEESSIFCADVTSLNHNVMFELGYAIAQNKRIWLCYDPSFTALAKNFEQLKILTTVGYSKYTNSYDVVREFLADRAYDDLDATVFQQAIAPNLPPQSEEGLFYLKSRHNTQASVALSNKIDNAASAAGIPLFIDDPSETTVQSLSWYGQHVYGAAGVICHFVNPARDGALLHNARYALVSGLAHGMHRPLLMLAEGVFNVPIDYRDLLKHYQTASEAEKHFDSWIVSILSAIRQRGLQQRNYIVVLEMARELGALRIGEFIAENEVEGLRHQYFVETAAYREALDGRQTIFVGRKGSGKSANLIKLADAFAADKRNLVCVIKPIAYDFQAVVQLLKRCREIDIKGYTIEALWKFLIYSEMANAAANAIRARASHAVESYERDLMRLADSHNSLLTPDFSIRLERCITALSTAVNRGTGIEERRRGISEALHSGFLKEFRDSLSDALAGKNRVCILIDNLDKAWDKQSDIPSLTEFLLGLLKAASRLSNDFRSVSATQRTVNVGLAVFIRADIFYRVMMIARERDKIPHTLVRWTDAEQLVRVLEERMISSRAVSTGQTVWERFFDKEVRGIPPRDYFLARIMRRPRDLLFFAKAAITTAINRKHAKVTADDILTAEKQYSQFAIDSILVENGISLRELETVIYEFAGAQSILSLDGVKRAIGRAGIPEKSQMSVLEHLCNLTFLGVEVRNGEFRFAEDEQEARKDAVRARKVAEALGQAPRYKVNPAFCAFLEIDETDDESINVHADANAA